jgi:hypothetical protein
MLSLVFFCLSSHYRFDLLPRYEPMSPRASVGYVQTISNDVAQASPRPVPLSLTYVISSDMIFSYMTTNPSQHAHLSL